MRLLFITATRIGDAVLSTGLLQHLIERHPGARITVAVGRVSAPLFEAVPGLDRIIAIDKRPFKGHWLGLWAATAGRRWDLVVDLRASAIGYLLLAQRRLILGKRPDAQHRVVELAELLGLDPPPAPTAWLAARHVSAAERLIPAGIPVLALGPAANWIGKQWRAERFAQLAVHLTTAGGPLAGARVAVFAAGHERAQARPVIEAFPAERVIDLVGGVDLPTVAACLRRCRLFIGNDSGLMHLAAAAGTPTLGLFGPSDERRYRPWGQHAGFVRTPETYQQLLPDPAQAPGVTETLMGGLSVATVADAASELCQRTSDITSRLEAPPAP